MVSFALVACGGSDVDGSGTTAEVSTPTPTSVTTEPTSVPPASTSVPASSSAAGAPDLRKVVGNGKTYTFPNTDDVPDTAKPDPCDLLPTAQAEAALGAPVKVITGGSVACTYVAQSDDGPSIEVEIGEYGTLAASEYARSAGGSTKAGVKVVTGIGRKAQSSVDTFNSMRGRTDVLTKQLWFWVETDPGSSQTVTEAAARKLANVVATAIASEFPS